MQAFASRPVLLTPRAQYLRRSTHIVLMMKADRFSRAQEQRPTLLGECLPIWNAATSLHLLGGCG